MNNPTRKKTYFRYTMGSVFAALVIFAVMAACTDQQAKAKPNMVFKDQAPKAGVVATIAGEEITDEMLVGEDKMEFFELKKREYELRMDKLKKIMVDRLVGAEAKKAGMSTEDYISKKIVKAEQKIAPAEFKKFLTERRIPESQINPQIEERIKAYLQTQKRQDSVNAYVAKLTKGAPVTVYFKKPKMDTQVEVGKAPAFGKDGAAVTIVEFSDFQCPFCARGADVVTEIKKKYGNKVKVAFKHFPLPMHPQAKPASEASMCINDQNADKFWKYHDLLFKNQDKLDTASLEKFANDVGIDKKKFSECLNSGKFRKTVEEDLAYGEKLGVRSTPTFFVNGQIVTGALPFEAFAEMIDEELSDAKK